jgi:hypothetical protein
MEPEGVRCTGGLAVGGVGWCEPRGAVGRTIAVDRRRTAGGWRWWERQAELARAGLRRHLPCHALGGRRPLAGHVARVSHASLLPQPRTARANRRQDAGGAVTVTAALSRHAGWTASGHGRSFADECRPAEDSGRVVHPGLRLARCGLGLAVVAARVGSAPPVLRRDRMRAARRTHRPLWTTRRRRQGRRRVRPGLGLGIRAVRRGPRRRTARGVHSGLRRFVALEMRQPLVVGQLASTRGGVVRGPPAHGLRQLVRRPLTTAIASRGLCRRIRTPRPMCLRATARRRLTPVRNRVGGSMPRRRRRGPVHRRPTGVRHPRRRGPAGVRPARLRTRELRGPRISVSGRLRSRVGRLGPAVRLGICGCGVRPLGARRLVRAGGRRRRVWV